MNNKLKAKFDKIRPYIPTFLVTIAIPMCIGLISAMLTKENTKIYEMLKLPPLSPPAIIFPFVWTLLFLLMGISSAIIYLNRDMNPKAAKSGFSYYAISLALNLSWSILFFNLNTAFFACVVLLTLLYTIIQTIIQYRKINGLAAYMQIPYALWVTFAGYLNAAIWLIN